MKKHAYIPDGYNAVMPALAIKDAASAIKWYQKVFDATEKMVLKNPDNTIAHGEIMIGDTVVMVSEENPQYNKSPKTLNGNSVNLCIYVQNVDTVVQKAIDNGSKLLIPVEDQFYGDRSGRIEDPFGYIWVVSTHIKDVSVEEMKKIMDEWVQQQA